MGVKRNAAALGLAIALAAPFEGLRQWAYVDPVGIPTICFGSTKNVKLGDYKTVEECKALLTDEMQSFVDTVDRCVPGLPLNVLAAFGSAAYNLGPKVACDTTNSRAARYLLMGRFDAACNELPRWDKATIAGVSVALPGLTKRRLAEKNLCLQGGAN